MQQNKTQRRGKPSQLQVIQTNLDIWLNNEGCKELYLLLQEGTHSFSYCSRKGESLSLEEEKKKSRVLAASRLLGINVHPDKAIVLFFKTEQQLADQYNHQLIAQLLEQLKEVRAEKLIQLSYMLDEKFISELITIIDYRNSEELLPMYLLNKIHLSPDKSDQIVKNAYLQHVKENENPLTFEEFLRSQEAYFSIAEFAHRINETIYLYSQ
ncbi:unnamed protein product [Paramecium octaurelia]|uniref:Uncharacterized protein n=1 Tax=Paramecium octaurelia TaxID=43137 RepID=A0A8S1VG08_PAROT|nr:unnamed protein product [Paramecium octaurelia]